MKKIISILLMLSMAFSLVACSTEPASDVVDNDNADVSSEVSEEVSDNEDEVRNVSLDELEEHELAFIDTLVSTEWQSYSYTEDHENWIDNYDISIDFKKDFTVTYTDENSTSEGEWKYGSYDAEHEYYFVDFTMNEEEFGCAHNLNSEYMNIYSRERDFGVDFSVDKRDEHNALLDEQLLGKTFTYTDLANVPLVEYPDQYKLEFFENGEVVRILNGVEEKGSWTSESVSESDTYITMVFSEEEISGTMYEGHTFETYDEELGEHIYFQEQRRDLSDVVWSLYSIKYSDGTRQSRTFNGVYQTEELQMLFDGKISFSSGTEGSFVDGESEFVSFTSDTDISNVKIYDAVYLYGTEEIDYIITSDFFSQYNSDARNTVNVRIRREPDLNGNYDVSMYITTDSMELMYIYY